MPPRLAALKARIQDVFKNMKNARARRHRALSSFLGRRLPHIRRDKLDTPGTLWLLFLPSSLLGRGIYIDENALQPSQVNTYWNWGEVHRADQYLNALEQLRDRNATSLERAEHLKREFEMLGLHAATQPYKFTTASNSTSGVNAYAVFSAPRTSGTEAMVISASWTSRMGDGALNLRGVATVLALAMHLKRYSHWARDIIFVVGDDHLSGMHAWLSAYHAEVQSNLEVQPLELTSGVIWTALNIDYPGHSFSHLGAFYEGLNGRLPNQDLYNSFQVIARHTGGVPVVLYDHLDPRESEGKSYPTASIPSCIRSLVTSNPTLLEFSLRARNIARHMFYQASGKGSGVHALYHKYRIDAITLFAVPAQGPHGFYTIGKTIESTLRTMNNLLERLHASFFFYIMTTPTTFLKIGHYLPSVIMISVATMFGGLRAWVLAGWRKEEAEKTSEKEKDNSDEWIRRRRPVIDSLLVMLATHALGALFFFVSWKGWAFSNGLLELENIRSKGILGIFWLSLKITVRCGILKYICVLLASCIVPSAPSLDVAPPSTVLKALILCLASTIVSVISLLNFSLAALLCFVLIFPITFFLPSGSDSQLKRRWKHVLFLVYAMLVCSFFVTGESLWDWNVLGVWFAPFISIVCAPILLQASVACALSLMENNEDI